MKVNLVYTPEKYSIENLKGDIHFRRVNHPRGSTYLPEEEEIIYLHDIFIQDLFEDVCNFPKEIETGEHIFLSRRDLETVLKTIKKNKKKFDSVEYPYLIENILDLATETVWDRGEKVYFYTFF